jgi:hypothetical protein
MIASAAITAGTAIKLIFLTWKCDLAPVLAIHKQEYVNDCATDLKC